MTDDPQIGDALSVEFDSPELPITQLADLVQNLMGLVGQLESRGASDDIRVTWVVRSLSKSSPLVIELVPVARMRGRLVGVQPVRDLPRVLIAGVEQLMREAERPTAFSDASLAKIRALSEMTRHSKGSLRLRSGGAAVDVSGQVAVNVDKILEAAYRATGTVEGNLDAINIHGSHHYFAVYDDLTSQRIECSFGSQVSLSDVAKAIGRRVAVHGEISYRQTGTPISIVANRMETFSPDNELPSVRDVLGILNA